MEVNINALQGWVYCNLKHICKIQTHMFSILTLKSQCQKCILFNKQNL